MMRLTFLGTGTSCGVPVIGCTCPVCTSQDPRDSRLRQSVMIESESTRLLIDCGPDFRQQMIPLPFKKIDGILLSHIHFDHVGGIDDLRPYCVFGDIDLYADELTVEGLHHTMPYCFGENLYPGVPRLNLQTTPAYQPFSVGDMEILPFTVMHGKLPILGWRIGNLAYITDMKTLPEESFKCIEGVETLILNALRWKYPHNTHLLVSDALEVAKRVGAKKTWFIHMSHDIGLHTEANRQLPPNVQFAYDGLTIEV